MLIEHDDRVLVGRQPGWPPGRYSALAGFLEPGESIEEAVARETLEEAGVRVHGIRYVASQPWPFPSSLMIGLMAEIDEGELFPDDDIEDAKWFTRPQVRELYEENNWAPKHFSISRLLIETWLAGGES